MLFYSHEIDDSDRYCTKVHGYSLTKKGDIGIDFVFMIVADDQCLYFSAKIRV